MSNVIQEGMNRRKEAAEYLAQQNGTKALKGLPWHEFIEELKKIPTTQIIDQIVACELYDILNPQQKDLVEN